MPLATLWLTILGCAGLPGSTYRAEAPTERPYVFGWPDYAAPRVKLRGGTSTGAPVTLRTAASAAWEALQQPGLSARERDQAAIRALAGDYRTTFDFLETVVFDAGPDAQPATPYRSWGTERVYLVEDRPGFVSLQHVMVLFMLDAAGNTLGPFVQKHWRQDWTWEPEVVLEFRGFEQFRNRALSDADAAGRWAQTVYQVDDTPRYTLVGRWSHTASYSAWSSEDGWRPLPRRERTVRDDYHAMTGTNRITVGPTGWVHEQDNLKTVLAAAGEIDATQPARAREAGVNRYDLLDGFDFSAGDAYWRETGPFWAAVRRSWAERLLGRTEIAITDRCDDRPIFKILFELAEASTRTAPEEWSGRLGATLDCATGERLSQR